MDKVTIYWRRDDRPGGLYHASFKGEDCEFQGTSADEAIGWLIRETVLSGRRITIIDFSSDEVPYVVDEGEQLRK